LLARDHQEQEAMSSSELKLLSIEGARGRPGSGKPPGTERRTRRPAGIACQSSPCLSVRHIPSQAGRSKHGVGALRVLGLRKEDRTPQHAILGLASD
jgi:hypothetical protein